MKSFRTTSWFGRSKRKDVAVGQAGSGSGDSAGPSNGSGTPRDVHVGGGGPPPLVAVPAEPPAAPLPPGHSSIRILPILLPDETGEPSEQSQQEVAVLLENFALRHGSLFWPQMMRSVDIHKGDRAAIESSEDCDILHVCGEPWPQPLASCPKDSAGGGGGPASSRSSIDDEPAAERGARRRPYAHSDASSGSLGGPGGLPDGRTSRSSSVSSSLSSRVSVDEYDGALSSRAAGSGIGGMAGGSSGSSSRPPSGAYAPVSRHSSTGADKGDDRARSGSVAGGGGGGRAPGGGGGGGGSSAVSGSAGDADDGSGGFVPQPPKAYHSEAVLELVSRLADRSPDSAPAIVVLNTGMSAHFAAKLVAAVPSLHVIAWATPVETDGCLEFTASFYQALPDILAAELVEFEKTSVSTAMVYSAYNSAMNRMRSRGFVALDPTPYVRKRPRPAGASDAAGAAAGPAHGGSFSGAPGGGGISHGGGGSSTRLSMTATAGPDGSMQATSFAAFTSLDLAVTTVRDATGRTLRPFGVPVFVTSLDSAHGRHPAFSSSRLLRRNIITPEQVDAAAYRAAAADEADLDILSDSLRLIRMPLTGAAASFYGATGLAAGGSVNSSVNGSALNSARNNNNRSRASSRLSEPDVTAAVAARGAASVHTGGSAPGGGDGGGATAGAGTRPVAMSLLPDASGAGYEAVPAAPPVSNSALYAAAAPPPSSSSGGPAPSPPPPVLAVAPANRSLDTLDTDSLSPPTPAYAVDYQYQQHQQYAPPAASPGGIHPSEEAMAAAAAAVATASAMPARARSPAYVATAAVAASTAHAPQPSPTSEEAAVPPLHVTPSPPLPPLPLASPPAAAFAGAARERELRPGLRSTRMDAISERLGDFTTAVDITLDRSVYDSDAAALRETTRLLKFVETGAWRAGTAFHHHNHSHHAPGGGGGGSGIAAGGASARASVRFSFQQR